MSSELARQLSSLRAGTQSTQSNKQRQRARDSFLYDGRDAAELTVDAIFDDAVNSFYELCRGDAGLSSFEDSLFSLGSVRVDRELEDQDFNDALDKKLNAFLLLLSAHFLLRPAHRVLEYLVRRHLVHRYNVDALLACALPYHSTALFPRVVRLIHLDGT